MGYKAGTRTWANKQAHWLEQCAIGIAGQAARKQKASAVQVACREPVDSKKESARVESSGSCVSGFNSSPYTCNPQPRFHTYQHLATVQNPFRSQSATHLGELERRRESCLLKDG